MPSVHTDAPVKRRFASEEVMRATALRHARIVKLSLEGLTSTQIASDVGISPKQVRVILNRTKPIPVPAWVPDCMHEFYRDHGRRHGEQAAASECRRLKSQVSL